MNDFMTWLYEHYIEPEIRLQPKDDGDTFRFSLMESAAAPQEAGGHRRRPAVLRLPRLPAGVTDRGGPGAAALAAPWAGPPAPAAPGGPPPPARRRGACPPGAGPGPSAWGQIRFPPGRKRGREGAPAGGPGRSGPRSAPAGRRRRRAPPGCSPPRTGRGRRRGPAPWGYQGGLETARSKPPAGRSPRSRRSPVRTGTSRPLRAKVSRARAAAAGSSSTPVRDSFSSRSSSRSPRAPEPQPRSHTRHPWRTVANRPRARVSLPRGKATSDWRRT